MRQGTDVQIDTKKPHAVYLCSLLFSRPKKTEFKNIFKLNLPEISQIGTDFCTVWHLRVWRWREASWQRSTSFAVDGVDDSDSEQAVFVECVWRERVVFWVKKTSTGDNELSVCRWTNVHHRHVFVSVDLTVYRHNRNILHAAYRTDAQVLPLPYPHGCLRQRQN